MQNECRQVIRRKGYAVTTNAMIPRATAVAAPVFATEASLPLVVVIVLPRSRTEPVVVDEMCAELLTRPRRSPRKWTTWPQREMSNA